MRTAGAVVLAGAAVAVGLLSGGPLPAQALAGRVVDAAQRPMAAVPVRLLRAAPRDTGAAADTTPLATGVTASDGAFMLLAPGPGTYRARIGDAFLTPAATLASADSVDMREYRLVAPPRPPTVVVISPHPAADSAACRGAVRCSFRVEKQAATVPGTLYARYPANLRGHASTDGRVTVQFVVDTSGHAEMSTLRVLEASDPVFIPEVRAAVARARFYPAELARHPVRQLVQLPFTFTLTRDSKGNAPPLFGPPFKPLPAPTGFP